MCVIIYLICDYFVDYIDIYLHIVVDEYLS